MSSTADDGGADLSASRIEVLELCIELDDAAQATIEAKVAVVLLRHLDAALEITKSASANVRLRLIVAADYESRVKEALREHGRHSEAENFRAQREAVVAGGKTITRWIDSSTLEARCIVDGAAWAVPQSDGGLGRLFMLAHELAHVAIDVSARGREEPSFGTHELDLRYFCRIAIDEFHADQLAALMLDASGLLKNAAGDPGTIAELHGAYFAEPILTLLDSVREWTVMRVQFYHVTSIGLDAIYEELMPRVVELFTALAHLLGMNSRAEDPGVRCRAMLEQSLAFRSARVSLALAEFALGHCDLPLVDDYPDRDGFRLLFFFAEAHLFNELPGNHEDRLSALTAVKAWGLAHGQVAAERGPSLGATLLSISAISLGMWPDVDKTKWGDGLARALGKAAKLLKDTPATIQALAVAALTETIAPWALGRADPLHMPERVRERAACAAQAAVSPHGASPQQPLSGSR